VSFGAAGREDRGTREQYLHLDLYRCEAREIGKTREEMSEFVENSEEGTPRAQTPWSWARVNVGAVAEINRCALPDVAPFSFSRNISSNGIGRDGRVGVATSGLTIPNGLQNMPQPTECLESHQPISVFHYYYYCILFLL